MRDILIYNLHDVLKIYPRHVECPRDLRYKAFYLVNILNLSGVVLGQGSEHSYLGIVMHNLSRGNHIWEY